MISKKIMAFAAAALLAMSVASNANQPLHNEAGVAAVAPDTTQNVFDPNYWMAAFANPSVPTISGEMKFNAAHPSAWMQLVDPTSHMQMHRMFANPASYIQFMRPQFYLEFTKPENMMAWMNPASFEVMMNQQTMNYWMNPATYTHMIDPAMYQETLNPANYMVYLNPNTYAALLSPQTCDADNPNQGWFGFGCQGTSD
jgi:hypothetical protein